MLIARAMKLAVMDPANRKLAAHFASERTRLGKGPVMRIGWHTAAYEAGLSKDEFPVVLVAHANRLAQSMHHVPAGLLLDRPRSFVAGARIRPTDGHCSFLSESMRSARKRQDHIRCLSEWRSLRGLVIVRAIADGG
jgi:hypothetical protein